MWLRLLLGIVFSCSFVISEPAWFQVCDTDHKFQINSVDCSLGVWLKKPLEVDCVCVNGVWVISKGLCDDEFQVLVGAGDCFTINNEIRSVKLLGNIENPFSSATFVATPELDAFVRVPSGTYSPTLDSPASIVITVNLTNNILQRSDRQVCLQVEDSAGHKPVHIWKNFRRESNRFKVVDSNNCDELHSFHHHIGFGEIFQDDAVLPNNQVAQNCAKTCLSPPGKYKARPIIDQNQGQGQGGKKHAKGKNSRVQPRGRAATPNGQARSSSRSSRIVWDDLYSLNYKLNYINGGSLTAKEREEKMNIYSHRFNLTERNIAFAREAREQTVRMMQAHTSFMFLDQPTVKVNSQEYDYFEIARQIFISVVPKDIMEARFVNGITRMFRQLVWESHDKFSYTEHPNAEQHSRIKQSLEACLVNVSTYPMFFVDVKNFSTHDCVNKSSTTIWNATEDPSKPGHVLEVYLSNTTTPVEVKFNVNSLDFVVEMAWKIAMMTHYHCSLWFKERGYDHSQMSSKLMSLFNEKVAKRWQNPHDSLKVYQELFQGVDFERMAIVIDRVVEAARDASDYTKWLLRPRIPIGPNDLSSAARLKRDTREKREKKQYRLWGSRAACMTSFTDPTEKFQYSTKSDCYISPVLNALK